MYASRPVLYYSSNRVVADVRELSSAHQVTVRVVGPTADEPVRPAAVALAGELGSAEQAEPVEPKARFRPFTFRNALLYGMAATVFAVGLVVSLGGARANHQVAAQVKQVQKQADAVSDTVVPSTTKPSTGQVAHYAVSPNLPRYIDIPKLSVHSRVLSEGVNKQNELQVPWNIYDTGWYNASSQPGQNGAMLIDGHSGVGAVHGIFYKLGTLQSGDPIAVTRGDGQQFTYLVTSVQTVNVQDVDMAAMLVSADTAKPGLNLITCAGDIIPGTMELNKRVLVRAVLQ